MKARALAWLTAAVLCLVAATASAQPERNATAAEAAVRDAAAEGDAGEELDAAFTVVGGDAGVEGDSAISAMPRGRGLPIVVRVATQFVEVLNLEENDETFTATVDVRIQWDDLRHRLDLDPEEGSGEYREWRGAEADTRLGEIWSPDVRIANMVDEPTSQHRVLRIHRTGHVELLQRTRATFRSPIDASRFPFDEQMLQVVIESQRDNLGEVAFDWRQEDLEFSQAANGVSIPGWSPKQVSLRRENLSGWHGNLHARTYAELAIERSAARTAPAIFIPLLASLLIPLLAIWLNRAARGQFAIEAFELTNVVVGGLFAVIALNFTVNAEYKVIAAGDNTVSRLFALNYTTLGVSLAVNILLYRFNLVLRWFGPLVQEQVFRFCLWSIPLLSLSTAAAIVAAAMW